MKQPWTLGSHSSMHKSKDVSEETHFKSKRWQSEIPPIINSFHGNKEAKEAKTFKEKSMHISTNLGRKTAMQI